MTAFDPKSKDGKKVIGLMADMMKQLNSSWKIICEEANKISKAVQRYKAFKESLSDGAEDKKANEYFHKNYISKNKDLVAKWHKASHIIKAEKTSHTSND